MTNEFSFDVDAEVDNSISDGENYDGTKAGWSFESLKVSEGHDSYDLVAEYKDWTGNDINTRHKENFVIGVTEDGDIHRWEMGENGPDYGEPSPDPFNPEEALEEDEHSPISPDRPTIRKNNGIDTPEEVAESYLEKRTGLEVEQLFN